MSSDIQHSMNGTAQQNKLQVECIGRKCVTECGNCLRMLATDDKQFIVP
jgi:hypothetical protein